ncbi:hypothetical protein NEUTE1DRAFT_137301 [Neurospora tetrasperma FGSC 2508]|uniref:C2H2-type domain-containing protein n=1 Tax=Neurospora tetrasperma (strain FGSC 2508 / ATCC MYA-4615 / P0657) TaxID=510951 RepID=F8MKU6_NEUT8|nr:uncharacterized protein NEUTE1DRAFT_137301 [Neurospora tetrasperma FGSC 2508]EGO57474.1 hypothetical protein NEUTE1DRAFT_137301 [Neurospora tetrasperma FGSC 2508]
MSLRSFDPWDLQQEAVALDNPTSGKRLEFIDPTLTCLGCELSFPYREYLFYHLAKNPNHYRDLMPGEHPINEDLSEPFELKAFYGRQQERFKRSCMFCDDDFDSRDALFEHLEEYGHAMDRETRRRAPGYKRPEICKKRDRSEHPHRKAKKTIAKLEKEREEYRLVLQEQRRQRLATELRRKKEEEEEEEEQLQKLKREEELRREQEKIMKHQEQQKRQRELDNAEMEAKQRQEAQQRQANKRIKTNASGFVCRVCAGSFETRNQLFSHIKRAKHWVPMG